PAGRGSGLLRASGPGAAVRGPAGGRVAARGPPAGPAAPHAPRRTSIRPPGRRARGRATPPAASARSAPPPPGGERQPERGEEGWLDDGGAPEDRVPLLVRDVELLHAELLVTGTVRVRSRIACQHVARVRELLHLAAVMDET